MTHTILYHPSYARSSGMSRELTRRHLPEFCSWTSWAQWMRNARCFLYTDLEQSFAIDGQEPDLISLLQKMSRRCAIIVIAAVFALTSFNTAIANDDASKDSGDKLALSWKDNILTIHGDHLPGRDIRVWYLEAYCRPGSTDREWKETTIGHATKLVSQTADRIELQCRLSDGVIVDHTITATADEVDFRLVARNPTDKTSLAHWAQPCIRVGDFTGSDQQTYLAKSFLFVGGRLERMPTKMWATKARYTPGQVWAPKSIDRNDVNPRPLNPQTPDNGLIGCFSADERMIMATAWEPYQELFQGVIVCLHSDFRIGGLEPGETKKVRGKIYLVKNDVSALLMRYAKDFPEHVAGE